MKNVFVESTIPIKNKDIKWNFVMGLIHGTFFTGGQAFINPDTILPVFLNHFTISKILIGLSSTMMGSLGGIGNALPQLFVANRLENKIRKIPILRIAITIRALCWLLISLITYLFAIAQPNLTIFFLFFSLILFSIMGGIANVPFLDIWGKALPSNLRGRFFGYRQLLGGVLAIGSGFIVKAILSNEEIHFPNNFVLLFSSGTIFLIISFIGLGSVKEPISRDVHKNRLTFKDFLKKSFTILKIDSNYRKFLYIEVLTGAGAMALPFYVLYAKDILKIKLEMVGVFLLAQMLGNVLSNVLWAQISDRVNNKKVIQISTFLALIVPLIALVTPKDKSIWFILLFILVGFFIAGRKIGITNFILDIAPPKDRPTYISLNGTFVLPVTIFPLIGGIIVQYISYNFLFIITMVAILFGFILSLKLKDPRDEKDK